MAIKQSTINELWDEYQSGTSLITIAETLLVLQDEETMAAIREVDETPYDELELFTEDELPW